MCGIAGIVGFSDPVLLRRMTSILSYRGPDDDGFFESDGIGLGHRRLSIIDLDTGKQPIWSADGEAVIVYNGEIYNFPTLRRELEAEGVSFRTNTDTEVIVNLYRREGDAFVQRLNGIFAFAIWDLARRRLLLARDHLGVKPLHYLEADGAFLFASEIKSILLWDRYKPEVAPEALRESLVFSYIPGEETLFRGIRKLPPGHLLVFENDRSHLSPYWKLPTGNGDDLGERHYATRLLKTLQEAVRGQMISDVPLGATLSGGLDSSIIVGLMSRVSPRPVKTFSVGIGGRKDELGYAGIVARHFKTDHQEFRLEPARFNEILPRVLWHLEEPILSSIIPTYYLAEAARKLVKVILIGEGSDELFAGYRRLWPQSRRYRPLVPDSLRRSFYFWHFSSLGSPPAIFSPEMRARLRGPDPVERYFVPAAVGGGDVLNRLLAFEQRYQLADFQLLRIDRLTMAHSVEARVPYLDPRVVEFAASIPSHHKLRGHHEKRILRLAARDLLPPEILARRKQGLGTPLIPWFRAGGYEVARQLLSPARVKERGYFDAASVEKLFRTSRHTIRHREDLGKLFKLMMFEVWHRIFIDRPIPDSYTEDPDLMGAAS